MPRMHPLCPRRRETRWGREGIRDLRDAVTWWRIELGWRCEAQLFSQYSHWPCVLQENQIVDVLSRGSELRGGLCEPHTTSSTLYPLPMGFTSGCKSAGGFWLQAPCRSGNRIKPFVLRTPRAVGCKNRSDVTWPRLELFGSWGVISPQLGAWSWRFYVLFE